MSHGRALSVIGDGTAARNQLTRREVVRRLLAGLGAGAAWPLVTRSHPIYEHLENDAVFAEAEKLGAADWKPVFLNARQNESLIALAEGIVPGSTKAQVNRFLDLLVSVDKPENQRKFVESLAAFDGEAQKRFEKSFPALDNSEKSLILSDASAKDSVFYGQFENLKGWVSGAFYSSEMGMRELGWTGDYAFEKFPGCEHPEGHW